MRCIFDSYFDFGTVTFAHLKFLLMKLSFGFSFCSKSHFRFLLNFSLFMGWGGGGWVFVPRICWDSTEYFLRRWLQHQPKHWLIHFCAQQFKDVLFFNEILHPFGFRSNIAHCSLKVLYQLQKSMQMTYFISAQPTHAKPLNISPESFAVQQGWFFFSPPSFFLAT